MAEVLALGSLAKVHHACGKLVFVLDRDSNDLETTAINLHLLANDESVVGTVLLSVPHVAFFFGQ